MSNSPFPQTHSIPGAIGADVRVSAFLRSVYGWMFLGLAITALTATFVAGSRRSSRRSSPTGCSSSD